MEKGEIKIFSKGKQEVISKTNKNVRRETKRRWGIMDSGLLGDEMHYSFDSFFSELYPKEYKNIKEYIETYLKEKKGSAVGLEVGGVGSKLFSGFTEGFFEKTVGVAKFDTRYIFQKQDDSYNNHSVLLTNALISEGFRKIKKELANKKVDVIFEKMHGAILNMPGSLVYFGSILQLYYSLLNDKGLLFFQTPPIKKAKDQKILEEVLYRLKALPGLSIEYTKEPEHNSYLVRFQKDERAPKDLRPYF